MNQAYYSTSEQREAVLREALKPYGKIVEIGIAREADCYAAVKKANRIEAYMVAISYHGDRIEVYHESDPPPRCYCPRKVLDILTHPAPSPEADAWREECRRVRSAKQVYREYRIVVRKIGKRSRRGIIVTQGGGFTESKVKDGTGYASESEAQRVLDSIKYKLDQGYAESWIAYI